MTKHETKTTNTAERAHEWINARIAEGKTVYLSNMLRVIRISPATVRKWKADGRDLFRVDADGLRIAQGNRYDLIATPHTMLVKISAQ